MTIATFLANNEVVRRARRGLKKSIYFLRTGYFHTGERVHPDFPDENFQNHLKVYQFVQQFAVGKDALDVGCGSGYGTALLATVTRSIVGIDISPTALKWARKRYKDVHYLQMDVHKLEFPDASFDFIVSSENFEHLADQKAHAAELARVLRPDGLCIVFSPNPEMMLAYRKNPFHTKENSFDELLELFSRNFFDVTVIENSLSPTTAEGMKLREERWSRNSKGGALPSDVDTTWLSNTHSFACFLRRPRTA